MSASTIAIWRPETIEEIQEVKVYAGLYRAGVVEVWDTDQLDALVRRRNSGLIVMQPDIFSTSLVNLNHPENAVYLLPPAGGQIAAHALLGATTVKIEQPGPYQLRPSVAGAILLHHRYTHLLQVAA